MGKVADAARWEPGFPQQIQEGECIQAWWEPAEPAKETGPLCLCKYWGAICIGKM
jgi:hypothetical protein